MTNVQNAQTLVPPSLVRIRKRGKRRRKRVLNLSTLLSFAIFCQVMDGFQTVNLLPTVRSDCKKKFGCDTHCFQRSEASPIGQLGVNLFKNYLVWMKHNFLYMYMLYILFPSYSYGCTYLTTNQFNSCKKFRLGGRLQIAIELSCTDCHGPAMQNS